ncbi:MAG: hypothetical protein LJE88_12805 [Deltaproteobacteria bacterium]|nr:hypothetical protein [Deltaproteobacteria bacterium]
MFRESLPRAHEDGRATWQPEGVGFEACLNGTSQESTPEDAKKNGHIIRARSAPLSPAPQAASARQAGSQFRGRSR